MTRPRTLEVDVVVVGAGVSGLVAATCLRRAGRSVAVLEARDRVGGRLLNLPLPGAPAGDEHGVLEAGGQWVGPGQPRVLALVDELGLRTFAQHTTGREVLVLERGSRRTYGGTVPRLAPHRLAELGLARRRFDRLAATVPVDAPWAAPHADALDGQTLRTWLHRRIHSHQVRELFDVAVGAIWGTSSAELSLLYALWYARCAGGLDPLLDTEGGAQDRRVVGGLAGVATRLADRLGDDVRLGWDVAALLVDDQGVSARTASGDVLRASRAVLALPPALQARLEVDPPWPADDAALLQRSPHGAVVKCFAVYDEPWWRAAGLSGQAVSLPGPATAVFDVSPPDASRGVLLGFVDGPQARAFVRRPAPDRRRELLEGLVDAFGTRARTPEAYVEQDWTAEVFSRGCPVGHLPPGVLSVLGPSLRRPVGRVHKAGTETSTAWPGYVEGAVVSGERVAREVTAALDADRPG